MSSQLSFELLEDWKEQCAPGKDVFVHNLPKIELHVHIEGTISPELRWKLAHRNGISLTSPSRNIKFETLEQLRDAYVPRHTRTLAGHTSGGNNSATFFDLFDEGVKVLQSEDDFFELAMEFFHRCAERNVRYVEAFFGPHSHRYRGIPISAFMNGYRRAQKEAGKNLGIAVQWIMVLNRGKSLDEAWENYRSVALPYQDVIVGVGLAGNEVDRPPFLFDDVLTQARKDGFKVTVHCDLGMPNTHEHISQALTTIGGDGADRCDHGVNMADKNELIIKAKERRIGLTLCPWGYLIYQSENEIWPAFRKLYDAGVKITINSDDPPYMMGNYTEENLILCKLAGGFTNSEIVQMQKYAVEICWADDNLKAKLLEEIESYDARIIAKV
jgi:adenosine deaminase